MLEVRDMIPQAEVLVEDKKGIQGFSGITAEHRTRIFSRKNAVAKGLASGCRTRLRNGIRKSPFPRIRKTAGQLGFISGRAFPYVGSGLNQTAGKRNSRWSENDEAASTARKEDS